MTEMSAAARAFYEWFRTTKAASGSVPLLRDQEAFEAGWDAATKFIGSALDEEPAS